MKAQGADLEIRIVTEALGADSRFHFILHSPTGQCGFTHHTIQGEPIRGRPEDFPARLNEVLEALDEGVRSDGSFPDPGDQGEAMAEELAKIGRELYLELFPAGLREAYRTFRDSAETILLVSDEPWIPWELIKPYDQAFGEDDFLCCRFSLGRWLSGLNAPSADLGALELGAVRVACIEAGEAGGQELERAGDECRLLAELAERHSGVEPVILNDATHEAVDQLLRLGGNGILHFIGHGVFSEDDPTSSQFVLADGRALQPRDLLGAIELRIRQDRPLVFFNSCEAARQGYALSRTAGWTSRWVRDCGCGAFLGPQWNVDDTGALAFARTFYGALENGKAIGSAAKEARLAARREAPGSTAWLAYVVYAHPQARLRLGLGPTPLRVPVSRWRPEVSPPGALLQAEYGIVPFHGRDQELANLREWALSESPAQVRLYTGAGGMGKTRLALEICRQLQSDGWATGFLAPDPSRTPEDVWQDLRALDKPTLIVVDYAESRHEILVPLFRRMYQAAGGRIRLILLARGALDWWQQLQREGDGVGELLSGPATRWFSLRPLAMTPEERLASYRTAATTFAQHLSLPEPNGEPAGLEARHYERVLLLHMRALADVESGASEGIALAEENDLLDHILQRERRFWGRLADQRGLSPSLAEGIGRGMAAISLGGGAENENHAVQALENLRFFEGQARSVLVTIARLLHETYPGEKWIAPLLPDRLSEHLGFRELQKDADELLSMMVGPR